MNWILRCTAVALSMASMAKTLHAEPTAGPPAWNDKSSVYLAMSQAAGEQSAPSQTPAASSDTALPATPAVVPTAQATTSATTAPIVEPTVVPTAHEAPAEPAISKTGNRYLAPPSARFAPADDDTSADQTQIASAASRRLAEFGLPMQSLYTILSALAIVIGAFLLFTWALKRGSRGRSGRGALSTDVVSVLGRVPLAARHFAELLRVGNKLVLVSLTPTGAETLTEVTDPAEVDRLLGLCQQSNPFSTTKAFEQVFQQMSTEPAPSSFLGNESFMPPQASPAGAYRSNRGGSARG